MPLKRIGIKLAFRDGFFGSDLQAYWYAYSVGKSSHLDLENLDFQFKLAFSKDFASKRIALVSN